MILKRVQSRSSPESVDVKPAFLIKYFICQTLPKRESADSPLSAERISETQKTIAQTIANVNIDMLVVVVQFGIIVPTVIFRTNWRKEIKSSAKSGNKLQG
uniref:Uncharacterized protein n=1 Tax=Glossina palpalis gambiensis TaxID=67801 RepID=A0A1B0AXT0_9MUSC